MSENHLLKNLLEVKFVSQRSANVNLVATAFLIHDQINVEQDFPKISHANAQLITSALKQKDSFKAKFAEIKAIAVNTDNETVNYVLLVGLGDNTKLTEAMMEEIGGAIVCIANKMHVDSVLVEKSLNIRSIPEELVASAIASGAMLASYKFDKYKTSDESNIKTAVHFLEIVTDVPEKAEKSFALKKQLVSSVFFARDCINEPPNVLYPESYANKIADELYDLDVSVDIIGESQMRNLGMGAILGVGQGSIRESKIVVMEYKGGTSDQKPVLVLGKGVTFDSGGISIKPSSGMEEMKYDMSGSAAVVGLIRALALREATVNVVGIIGLVENMPGGNAQRPSDIVRTMSGKSIEVLNTDAEGRLVLADVVCYAQEKFTPACIIDLATLTGAVVVALGHTYAGLFANNDTLASQLMEAGSEVHEYLWRMPLHKDYDDMLKSDIADVANIGNVRGAAGSATGAHFIGRFVKNDIPWAHLDIAGVAWNKNDSKICPKGGVGYGIRLLDRFITKYYEQ